MPEDHSTDIQHPDLAAALSQLADSLDRRHEDAPDAPRYLDMAALADHISQQLHDLARMLVTAARARDSASWTDVGHAFGVTRQAAMRRWSTNDETPTPNRR